MRLSHKRAQKPAHALTREISRAGRAARIERNLTQQDVSQKMGSSHVYVARLEQFYQEADGPVMNLTTAIAWSLALGLRPTQLIETALGKV